ncbi:MAG: hypothetical protein ACOC43_03295 [Desulfohalobiaceae bacterium]
MSKKPDLAELRRLKADPIFFIRKTIGVEPTEQQAKLLEQVAAPGAHVSARSGHGTGKTTSLAWLVLWFVGLRPDCRVPCTAPTSHQLSDLLWSEISKWHERMHPLWRRDLEVTSDRVFVKGAERSQYAVARTARRENPEALQGFHATELMFLIDEASGIDERVFEVAEGALSTPGARVVMTSNPTRTEGYFHRSHHQERQYWQTLHLSCMDSPLVDASYIDKMRSRYGEESNIFRVRVLGEFPQASDDILIPLDWVESAIGRDITPGSPDKIAGLDVARFGDDANALLVRHGSKVIHLDMWRNKDLMETAGRVKEAYDSKLFTRVHVDSIGLGSGVVDRLKEMNVPVVGINVAEATAQKERFNRLRDQLWWQCRDFFHGKECGIDPEVDKAMREDLIGQLTSIRYGFTSNGKIKIEDKQAMKERGLESPNLADALCLTFAEGVGAPKKRNVQPVTTRDKARQQWRARTG